MTTFKVKGFPIADAREIIKREVDRIDDVLPGPVATVLLRFADGMTINVEWPGLHEALSSYRPSK